MIWRRGRDRHVSDAVLVDAYRGRGAQPLPADVDRHLRTCQACASRRADLVAFVGSLVEVEDRAAEASLTPDRLTTQRQRIMRRIGALLGAEPSARVLRFPAHGRPAPAGARPGNWLAAAVMAGLVVGMIAGQVVDFRQPVSRIRSLLATPPAASQTVVTNTTQVAPAADIPTTSEETFLLEIETALGTEIGAGLQAIDALTPRVQEVALAGR